MEALHAATRAKAGAPADALQSAEEREAAERDGRPAVVGRRSTACGRCCSRACRTSTIAPDPREAAEMALLRLIHAAELPDPATLIATAERRGARRTPAAAAASAKAVGADRRDCRPISRRWSNALEASGKHHLAQSAARPGRAGPLRAARAGPEADCGRLGGDWPRELGAGAQSRHRRRAGRCRCPTKPASRRCSTRRKWPRSAFAPRCWPIPTSAR